ncbi:MAG: DUF927 domain-containing protein [Thermodesulfobacterium sp.]|nr:DUF927 domain-containing protein [Thermodesulfobacterium sp.]
MLREHLPFRNWELREDGWYLLENGTAVRVLPYFKIRKHYTVGDSGKEYVEITDKEGKTYVRKVGRNRRNGMPFLDLVAVFGYINGHKIKEARKFLAHYIRYVKAKAGIRINFLGYKYINGRWETVVAGNDTYTRKELSVIFYGKDLEHSLRWYLPSVKGELDTFKEIYKKLFSIDDPPLHFAIAHFLSWIAKQLLKGSSVVPSLNPVLIFVGDTGSGKTIRGQIATALYGNPTLFSFFGISLGAFKHHFPFLKTPFVIDDVFMHTANQRAKFREFIYIIKYQPIEVPVLFTAETVAFPIDKVFAYFEKLRKWAIVLKLPKQKEDVLYALYSAVELLYSHHGHILSYVKNLTEQDKEWIKELAKRLYDRKEIQQLVDANLRELGKHIALSLSAYAHFFLYFIQACTEEELNRKLIRILEFVVKQIIQNQVGRVGKDIDLAEEVMDFLSKVDKFVDKHKAVKLKGISFKQVAQMIGYIPSHRAKDLLKKFFWKRYTSKGRSNTKLVFTPSCLISLPGLTPDGNKFDPSAPEVIYDRERLPTFTEEEARIWLEVFRRRHGDKWLPVLVRTFELDTLPQFQKILATLP